MRGAKRSDRLKNQQLLTLDLKCPAFLLYITVSAITAPQTEDFMLFLPCEEEQLFRGKEDTVKVEISHIKPVLADRTYILNSGSS